ncbi:MAG: RIP metalloprotease RseP [Kiritimatiellaeota bacterium]|nr:RIP metalloprotease RseP [Kiritimatiellota bacterium]
MTVILTNILTGAIVALLFGLVVFVHELGHFLAARWLGFRVTAFAIGFGPALWKKKVGHTVYRINAVPFGGYCMVPQLDPSGMEKIQGANPEKSEGGRPREPQEEEALPDMAAWRRIIVSLAGPAGNVALALVAAWLIYCFAPADSTNPVDARIGYVDEKSEAWQAGLRGGQVITQVDGRPVKTWYEFQEAAHIVANAGELVALTVEEEDGGSRTLMAPLAEQGEMRFVEGLTPNEKFSIRDVMPGSPAERAGVKEGDRVLMLNGRAVLSDMAFINAVAKNGEKPLALTVLRAEGGTETQLTLDVAPEYDPALERARIGVVLDSPFSIAWMQYRLPHEQLGSDAGMVLRVLKALTAPKAKGERGRVADSLGGPPAIFVMFWMAVKAGAWICLGLLRFLCVNLAILNLLPIPVLDGGHIIFSLWEIITRRKPHKKVVEALVNVFAVLIITLMLFMTFRDTWKLGLKKLVFKEPAGQAAPAGLPEEP